MFEDEMIYNRRQEIDGLVSDHNWVGSLRHWWLYKVSI